MDTTKQIATTGGTTTETPPAPRTRRGRGRRRVGRWVRPVYPMRAYYDAASEEKQRQAHTSAAIILEYWTGVKTKPEAAKALGVPPIRVWQMSQRAVAGMVAAMLKPPLGRVGPMPRLDPQVRELRSRIADLEKELSVSQSLVTLLRSMPGTAGREIPKEESDAARARVRGRRAKPQRESPSRGPATTARDAPAGG